MIKTADQKLYNFTFSEFQARSEKQKAISTFAKQVRPLPVETKKHNIKALEVETGVMCPSFWKGEPLHTY